VLAAVKAVLQPQFNAGAIATTTGGLRRWSSSVDPSPGGSASQRNRRPGLRPSGKRHHRPGPAADHAQSWGATADTMEKSTHGWPGKYTMCLAENAERNPWEPLHVELGFASETSIVVVVAARGLITIVEPSQESGLGDLAEPDSEGHGALALRP